MLGTASFTNVSAGNVSCMTLSAGSFNIRTYVPSSISMTNASCYSLNMTGGNVFMNANSLLYFYTDSDLSTTYSGARVVLWPGGGLRTSTDWYGFGMNGNTLVYNAPSSCIHSFQVNGTQLCYVNSTGLVMNGIIMVQDLHGVQIIHEFTMIRIYI